MEAKESLSRNREPELAAGPPYDGARTAAAGNSGIKRNHVATLPSDCPAPHKATQVFLIRPLPQSGVAEIICGVHEVNKREDLNNELAEERKGLGNVLRAGERRRRIVSKRRGFQTE